MLFILSFLLGVTPVHACATHDERLGAPGGPKWTEFLRVSRASAQANLNLGVPWGGAEASRWRPEAIAANTASALLKEFGSGARDVIVAVSLEIHGSEFHPYPDGQTNAEVAFGTWGGRRAPVAGVRIEGQNGSRRLVFHLDRELSGVAQPSLLVQPAGHSSVTLPLQTLPNGDRRAEMAAVDGVDAYFVRPQGWQEGFALSFAQSRVAVSELVSTLPQKMFADGRGVQDPEQIGSGGAFDKLSRRTWGKGFNPVPFGDPDGNVHGRYPHKEGTVTAVGRSWTWLAEPPTAPFKLLYACFERRRPDLEAQHGVPSGAGWHRIGDPAETVLNTLGHDPILTALGTPRPFGATPPSGREYSYGLGDSAAYRLLQEGEAFVTTRGQFHWYAIHTAANACVEIWVHPCEPSFWNSYGFRCQ